MCRTLGAIWLCVALVGLGGPAANGQTAQPRERLLSVVGEGTVRGRPDMALITAGVVSEAKSAREALSGNSQAMSRILDTLKKQGTEPRDLQTSGFSVEPVYSQPPNGYDGSQPFEAKIVGYRVRNELTLRIRALGKVGALLDQLIMLGANSISGPTFTVADPSPLEDQARRAAVRDALAKGSLYAAAANVALGPITRIEETDVQWRQPLPVAAMARADASEAVPIEGGELSFQARVAVSWRIGE